MITCPRHEIGELSVEGHDRLVPRVRDLEMTIRHQVEPNLMDLCIYPAVSHWHFMPNFFVRFILDTKRNFVAHVSTGPRSGFITVAQAFAEGACVAPQGTCELFICIHAHADQSYRSILGKLLRLLQTFGSTETFFSFAVSVGA